MGRGRGEGRLHLGVERDIAESDIVHLGLPPSPDDYIALLLSERPPSRRSGIPAHFLSTQTMNPVPFARYLSSSQGAIQIRKELLTRKVIISIKYDFNGGCSLKSR